MSNTKLKPSYMQFLESKGIYARGFFCFDDEPGKGYGVTRGYHCFGLDGEEIPFTENDLWERYGHLQKLSKEQFEQLQECYWDALRAQRGQPTNSELMPLVDRFILEYTAQYTHNDWQFVCAYDEETIRRILNKAADLMLAGAQPDQKQRQALFDRLFKDVVLARVAASLRPSRR